jgi:hypothetical protein
VAKRAIGAAAARIGDQPARGHDHQPRGEQQRQFQHLRQPEGQQRIRHQLEHRGQHRRPERMVAVRGVHPVERREQPVREVPGDLIIVEGVVDVQDAYVSGDRLGEHIGREG